ncbi:hypothetical protein J2T13_000365 [Paenibacillus sp. DS2015]|uniref:hypothetical protein n=1 Tax=Paenibacillus sp. DS2015 TaxID=3373917 RepID=UPI003D1DFD23
MKQDFPPEIPSKVVPEMKPDSVQESQPLVIPPEFNPDVQPEIEQLIEHPEN